VLVRAILQRVLNRPNFDGGGVLWVYSTAVPPDGHDILKIFKIIQWDVIEYSEFASGH
jgi:hypothetical protein